MEWKKYKLSDIGLLARGKSKHRPRDAAHLYGGKYPFIQTGDVKNANHRVYSYSQTYSEEGLKQSKLWPKNTICITIAANIADTAILNFPACFPDSVLGFIANEEKCDVDYIEYMLQYFQQDVQKHSIGSVQENINLGTFQNIEFPIPPLSTQSRIASILSSLDDKIELNRRMNQTLEQMAQALFNHYFVDNIDADNLPEGWKKSSLDKIADFLNGIALQKYRPKDESQFLPVIKIKELKNGLSQATEKADINIPEIYIIKDGDVLFSWSGSLEVDIWCNGKGALNQHLFKVSSNKYPKWFYFLWTKEHLQSFKNTAASKATTMGHIQRHHLTEAEVFLPPEKYFKENGKAIEPLIEQIILNRIENNFLTKIRDIILPKLMSGEIDVDALIKEEELQKSELVDNFRTA